MTGKRVFRFLVDENDDTLRIDAYLSGQIPELSRSRIQKALHAGDVTAAGRPVVKPSRKVHSGDLVELVFSPPKPLEAAPEAIPLDIVYEDPHLLVINKPPGMVVHPAPGHGSGTLVNALLAHCGDLSGIGGVLRPGIVHRLDGGTSGLLVAAKSDEIHISLSRQLMERKVKRTYVAIVHGEMPASNGVIDLPIGRSPRDRKKMAVIPDGGREAVTKYSVLDTLEPFQYIEINLGTGRTHQIRVHLSHAGHPVLGDPVYGGRKVRRGMQKRLVERAERALAMIGRQALHARELSFTHPDTGERVTFEAPLPDDFRSVLVFLRGDR